MKFKEFLNESKEFTHVYHVGPRSDMFKLRPIGHSKGTRASIGKGQPGLFVAPKFRDAVAWAVTYISHKKYYTQKPTERVKEKGGGWHSEKGVQDYKNLTIYKINVPKEILKKSSYTYSWEPEFFISSEHLDQMNIVSSKTYNIYELSKMYSKRSNKRSESHPSKLANIKKVAKTNLAARLYLKLLDSYNSALLQGKTPIFTDDEELIRDNNNHLVRTEIEKLVKYIFKHSSTWWGLENIPSLDKAQEAEVRKIYERVSKMIRRL
jgi:hypothetical protein